MVWESGRIWMGKTFSCLMTGRWYTRGKCLVHSEKAEQGFYTLPCCLPLTTPVTILYRSRILLPCYLLHLLKIWLICCLLRPPDTRKVFLWFSSASSHSLRSEHQSHAYLRMFYIQEILSCWKFISMSFNKCIWSCVSHQHQHVGCLHLSEKFSWSCLESVSRPTPRTHQKLGCPCCVCLF